MIRSTAIALAAALALPTVAQAAPINPVTIGVFTHQDNNINGHDSRDPGYRQFALAGIQRGWPQSGTPDRLFTAWMSFSVVGYTSVSNVTVDLDFNRSVRTDPGTDTSYDLLMYAQDVGFGAGPEDLTTPKSFIRRLTLPSGGPFSMSFDLTDLFNQAIEDGQQRVALRWEIDKVLADIPNIGNAGWGATIRYADSDVTFGPPPASPVPVPAAAPLFAGALGLAGWLRRKSR
ncbi:MAG: hypothetical protein HRU11_00960 [Parvularculaceae bacterium]|nr:hypothetical protein [Parvularculaceae bacterium]